MSHVSALLYAQVRTILSNRLTWYLVLTLSSDLLRRHLARHDMPTAPDPRRGRACDACHANKTKCDGGSKCTLCIKRGISCTYKHASKSNGRSSGSRSPVDDASSNRSSSSHPGPDAQESVSISPHIALVTPPISPADEVKASFKRIAHLMRTGVLPLGEATPIPASEHAWIEANSKDYFARFHDTWPFLHAPSYTIGMEDSFLVAVSVAMISCWLRSPDEFEPVVMELHETFLKVYSVWIVSWGSPFNY